MTAVMTAADDIDRDDLLVLLDLSARIVRGAPADWRTLAVGFRRGADTTERADALLLLAGPLTDVVDSGDEDVLLRAFLPRLPHADRATILADMREELDRAERFASCSDRGDVAELIDGNVGTDWVATAEQGAEQHRSSARHIAETAVLR